jgi:hypothetical protein
MSSWAPLLVFSAMTTVEGRICRYDLSHFLLQKEYTALRLAQFAMNMPLLLLIVITVR